MRTFLGVVAVVVLGVVACGDEVTTPPPSTGAGAGTSTGGGNAGGGGAGGAAIGEPCATVDGCVAEAYCDFPDDRCGAGMAGVCTERPIACSDNPVSRCGCNGVASEEGCASASGFDVDVDASHCATPDGRVFCGDRFCEASLLYCQIQGSDVGGEPNTYGCNLLPSECTNAVDCACVAMEPCGANCAVTDGGLTVTCFGG